MEQAQLDLLSDDVWTRLAAAESLSPLSAAGRYALRAALLSDRDARVRAQAAATLGSGPPSDAVSGWLIDGLDDPMPSVREACLRALGGHRAQGAAAAAARLAKSDPVWWVRRSAILALAMLAELESIPTLRQTLRDPFWRVRHAAVQALGLLGEAHPQERERIAAPEPGFPPTAAAALWYLRARFDPRIDIHKFPVPERPDAPLWNADPAVMTARLRAQTGGGADLGELVALLADPHQPLRQLAVQRLSAHASAATLRPALRHLEVPGLPHALATTWALLDSLGERARSLAGELLADPETAPGALRWAASWTARTGCEELFPALARQTRHPDAQARAAVAEALAQCTPCDVQALISLLDDADDSVRRAAALGLCQCGEEAALTVLQSRPPHTYPIAVRAALVALASRQADERAVLALTTAMADPQVGVRALALAELAHRGALSDAESRLSDPDPWIRAAVLRAVPAAWPATLASDADAHVRRQVMKWAVAARSRLSAAERTALAQIAAESADGWLRAQSCALLLPAEEAALPALLRLSRDPEPMVRAAAAAQLDAAPDGDAQLRRLLTQPAELRAEERAAAYARLLRGFDAPAAELLQAGLRDPGAEPPLVREQLHATALLFPESVQQSLPPAERRAIAALYEGAAAPPVPKLPPPLRMPAQQAPRRRPLGRTGVAVSPLALSGAHELTFGALQKARQAGVNLFFWEPSYLQLTRFLRRQPDRSELVIVAGTYEGDRFGIERDVRRALHRLRTDYLDVFLLFWTRSVERLSEEALTTLRQLKQAGRIRAFGISTHDRALARTAIEECGIDVVMTRHSAAHPGAETELLPLAAARGVGVLTFSAVCYTRLLRPLPGRSADGALPTAPECYRYSLSQSGVAACISAPRNHRELRENLTVLSAAPLELAPEREEILRAHGRLVREQNRRFDALIRKGHAGYQETAAPQQLRELLAVLMDESLPPSPTAADADDGLATESQRLPLPQGSAPRRRGRSSGAPRPGSGRVE